MENYSLCKEAAAIAETSPEDIGVPANNYVRKVDLVSSGKFDSSLLDNYNDNDFVLLKDVVRGGYRVNIEINGDVSSRGTVQINDGPAGSSASLEVDLNDSVTIKCNLNNDGDAFDGWYENGMKMSQNKEYTFQVRKDVNFIAKIFYMDLSKNSLQFEISGGVLNIQVTSNIGFTIS